MWRRTAGFTLVELITVIVVVAILAIVGIPRILTATYGEKGFHDAAKAAVQHARRTAVASRHFVCVNITPGSGSAGIVELRSDPTAPESVTTIACTTSGGGAALTLPAAGCASNQICAPSGVTLGGSSLIFDPLGRLVDTAKNVRSGAPAVTGCGPGPGLSVTVSNQSDIAVCSETGYVQ